MRRTNATNCRGRARVGRRATRLRARRGPRRGSPSCAAPRPRTARCPRPAARAAARASRSPCRTRIRCPRARVRRAA
ncbi:MAG: hypothetical protein FJ298_11830 [Planctomycetes bacterium]|nr:hypothetical protein [Planctomycetota bacterium]